MSRNSTNYRFRGATTGRSRSRGSARHHHAERIDLRRTDAQEARVVDPPARPTRVAAGVRDRAGALDVDGGRRLDEQPLQTGDGLTGPPSGRRAAAARG